MGRPASLALTPGQMRPQPLPNGINHERRVLLNERRVAHIYHNRDEWVYRLASNPYVLHRGGRKNRNQIVDEIKQSVSENHSRVRFWVSDDWESRSKYLETENGRLALITAVNWGGDDIWIATMMFGDHRREFDSLYKAVEWATQKARRWLESN